jgi:hypothetical protein
MKTQAKIPTPAVRQTDVSMLVPASPLASDAGAAANDELPGEQHDTSENPLWVINIAMAAFFITAALVMMIT